MFEKLFNAQILISAILALLGIFLSSTTLLLFSTAIVAIGLPATFYYFTEGEV